MTRHSTAPLTSVLSFQGLMARQFWARGGDGKRRHPFIRCRRAAATAIGAVVMSLMSLGGFALTSDHIHLVYQRDVLKAATDAASLAATRHWQQALGHLTDDTTIKTALLPLAKRYILANIPEKRRGDANATLQVTLTLHHGAGMVDVDASADLSGGLIFAGWMLDGNTVPALKITKVETRTERIEAGGLIEVALAIDSTGSMNETLDGKYDPSGKKSRMVIVKQAAKDLIDILTATGAPVAAGIVPWHYRVQFDRATRTRWEDNGWAVYPTRRYYPNPYDGSYKQIPRNSDRNWFPDPYLETNAGEWHDLPAKGSKTWKGCVDQRRMSGDDPPGISAALPTVVPFTMGFYSPTGAYPRDDPISYLCRRTVPPPSGDRENKCFYNPLDLPEKKAKIGLEMDQFNCRIPFIMPLTADTAAVKQQINLLRAYGSATYSTLGVVWGHRLLAPTWRTIWNNAAHPVDRAEGVQKALVLLTDGDDNHLDPVIVRDHRNKACTAAKNAGIKVFTIAAMDRSRVGELGDHLRRCSSQADDPEGKYVFINNSTPDDLKGAFQEVARQLARFRRVY